jgi:hypothetical protein
MLDRDYRCRQLAGRYHRYAGAVGSWPRLLFGRWPFVPIWNELLPLRRKQTRGDQRLLEPNTIFGRAFDAVQGHVELID